MKKLLLLIAIYLFLPTTVLAQSNDFDLSISPQIIQIELTPPAIAQADKTITLENNSTFPLPLIIKLKPFRPRGNNGEIAYLDSSERIGNDPSILDKIALYENNQAVDAVVVPPKTKKQLSLTASIPKDEPPGDYYFSVLFMSNTATPSAQDTYSKATGGIAMNVLLSIGPRSKAKGFVENFSTELIQLQGPVDFSVAIHNNSSFFISPKAQIVITNMFGQTIGKVDLLPVNILANSTRSLQSKEQFVYAATTNPDKNKQIDKIQKLLTEGNKPVAVWPEQFLLGPYKATLTVALTDEGPLYVKSIRFIGAPAYVLLTFIICVLVIILIRNRLRYRRME